MCLPCLLEVLTVLEFCLCKPTVYKLKILGGGKFDYYKSMGEPQKGGNQIFKLQMGGKQKGVGLRFLAYI